MKPLRPIFIASFFFSFHTALLSYLNSTVLEDFGGTYWTTFAYIAASVLSLVLIIVAPRVAGRTGSSKFLAGLLFISMVLMWFLGGTITPSLFFTLFIPYFALNTIIWYGFDLVIEHYSREQITGNIRGSYLTLNNLAWVSAPVISSIIANSIGFSGVYIIASMLLMISFLIISKTQKIESFKHLPRTTLSEAFQALILNKKARRIVSLYFVLQFFFAWMVIYMAPYLISLGFTWTNIGLIFSIMLMPFVLFSYPIGKIADKYNAERPLIILGFSIAALATMLLAIPFTPSVALFAGILFMTRVGASIIEVSSESAFFKEVTEHDTALISTLRMTLPMAYITAPLLGSIIMSFGNERHLYMVLSLIMTVTMLYAIRVIKVPK